jgi:hypothetical protein
MREMINLKTFRLCRWTWLAVFSALAALRIFAVPAHAELSAEELAKAAQNPIANMMSFPLQNNTNFNVGPYDRTQNILNIQGQAFYNIVRPDNGPDWSIRLQAQILLPKS